MNKLEQYKHLFLELDLSRAARRLAEEKELEMIAKMSDLWWELTPEEQLEIDTKPSAPESLGLVDQVAATGVSPRTTK